MSTEKVTVSIDAAILQRLDRLVKDEIFTSRSRAIQVAVEEKLERFDRTRLARELAKIDPAEEQAMAELGFGDDAAKWDPY
ncbi:MAG: ribbon-helix-helix protein, CopG family [Acidobacteria bacterium]|nr:ribbon-helix-helix protein, CopG family [Acidobacteriota bacterium]